MSRRSLLFGVAVLAFTAAAGGTGTAAPAWPTPSAFVSQLDLECFKTTPYTPPPTVIKTSHLNPVLADLPGELVKLGNREQLCVPVAKNGKIPPPEVLHFVQFVDLSCYRIEGKEPGVGLALRHLNPVLRDLPVAGNKVKLGAPEQLCVPVVKNGKFPPTDVHRLVQYIDLMCYAAVPPQPLGVGLTLSHLNPVLAHLPRIPVNVRDNRQLCVPVRKNDQRIPLDVLNIVRWIDLQKYDIVTQPTVGSIGLTLSHINPALVELPKEEVKIFAPNQLGLPVAKNDRLPPG